MSDAEATGRFTAAPHALERERDVATIANLFATDSDLGAAVSTHDFRGSDGAREFWESYRGWFVDVSQWEGARVSQSHAWRETAP